MSLIPNPIPPGVEVFNTGTYTLWAPDAYPAGLGTTTGGSASNVLQGAGVGASAGVGTFTPQVILTLAGVAPELTGDLGTTTGGSASNLLFGLTAFLPYSPPPPAPGLPPTPTRPDAGPKAPRLCGNCYDDLLRNEQAALRRVVWWPNKQLVSGCSLPAPDPHNWDPRQGRVINQVGNIPTPAPGAGNTVVNSYRVPTGYVAVLSAILQTTNTVGYTLGSDDLIWRLKIGRRYLKNYGDMRYKLGTLGYAYPLSDYTLVLPNDTITQLVEVPATSPGGPGQVTCGLYGWVYPVSHFMRAWFGRDSLYFTPFELLTRP